MPTTECATDMPLPVLQSEDARREAVSDALDGARPTFCGSKPLKGLFLGFTATVTIGLGLASWYLGVRMVAADEVAPSSPTKQAPPLAAPIAAVPVAAAPIAVIPPVNLYLQVAALGPKQDAGFVRSLRAKGFQGEVQTGDDGSARILIGPYSTRTAMEQARRKLQLTGVLAVETAY
jgi:hypothetical protein